MEATAVSLARSVLDAVLSRAGTAVADEVARLIGVPKEVDFICSEMEMMQAVLKMDSAHPEATGRSETARTWVKQVRELAYDFEDCLLDFALYADTTSRAASLLPAAIAERHRIAECILDLKARVDELNQRKQRYHIATNPATAGAGEAQAASSSMLPDDGVLSPKLAFKESDIIGRSHEKAKLTKLISRVEPEIIHEDDDHQAVTRTTPSPSISSIRSLVSNLFCSYIARAAWSPPSSAGPLPVIPLPPPTATAGSNSSGALRVVSVWGMGGMGKSSLVRMVRNDPEVLEGFDCDVWVTVPHPLDNPDVFIRRRLTKKLGLEHEHQIEEHLWKKRYLVVLDDVRTEEEWDKMCHVFLFDNSMDSRIIVTTRREDVARHCAGHVAEWEGHVYELKPLRDAESMHLLCQKVYRGSNCTLPLDMEEQASHILKRCRGLPLAISTIGCFLASRPKTSIEWRNLHEHLGAELGSNDLGNITKVIESSYDGLPYHLKSIFLYLSIFPENHEIRRTRLLRRWMAEGYIAKNHDMPAEDVGERCYSDLINRSMIQPSKASPGVKADRCRVHSILREIILSKSKEENQLFLIDKQSDEIPRTKIRHLVVSRWKSKDEKLRDINPSYIRSLTIFGVCPASLISPKLRLLRVLDLEDASNLKNDDLKHIGELWHLRYLSLRGTDVSKLPSSLQNLRYLETLDIQDTQVTKLPSGVAKLEKLCYLLAGTNFAKGLLRKMKSEKENHKLCCNSSCECCKILNLGVRAPEGIEKLQNLHMLGVVNFGNGNGVEGRLKKLTNLTNLRRLGVAGLTEKEGQDLCQSIGELSRLQRLEVRSDSLTFLAQMGEPLVAGVEPQIPRYLVSLRLCGNLSSLPKWISSLNDLAKVKLLGTRLKQGDIKGLQNLRNLTLLGLWEDSYIGDSLHFSTGTFLKLKSLDIDGLDKIETVTIEDGTMPELKKLWVNQCPSLQDNKSGLSGVPYLPNLNELLLKECGKKDNLTKILQRQVSGHKKRPKLLIGKSIKRSDS